MTTNEVFSPWAVVAIIAMIGLIVLLIGMILYTIYVLGPENEALLDEFKLKVTDMQCPELKQMLYERDYPRGYTYIAEHEYKWRCHVP